VSVSDQLHDLLPGTHVVTPRPAYTHHGIYVGEGRVVHYRGAVEEVTVEQFTNGRPLWVGCEHPQGFTREEVVRRARSRIGEHRYRLLTNNCEHFCEWCLWGEHRSLQVDEWISPFVRALQTSRGESRRDGNDEFQERGSGAAECA
jgi:lecithin:retinol acyltransferase